MIIYVAGPMTGYPEFNYPAFIAAAQALRDLGHDVLNPVDSEMYNDTGKPQTWDWYMRHALRMVLDAEAVALLPGWQVSRGAQLEHEVASALGLPRFPLRAWLAGEVLS